MKITFVFAFACLAVRSVLCVNDEMTLTKRLLDDVERLNPYGSVRPIFDLGQAIKVKFGVALVNIVNYDRDTNIIELKVWEQYFWEDNLLAWDPNDFGGQDTIHLPFTPAVWKPDIILFNSAEKNHEYDQVLGIASSNGSVIYIPPTIRKVKCNSFTTENSDVRVSCVLKYGSWTYDGFKLDLQFFNDFEDVVLSDYIMSNTMELVESSARRNVKYYPCCEEPYADLTFNLEFRML